MARITVNTGTLCGRDITALASSIVAVSAQANRMLAIWNAITNNGASPQALESSLEASFPPGTGATLYAGLQGVVAALNTQAATMAVVDQG